MLPHRASLEAPCPLQGCFPCCGAVRTRGQDEQTARLGDFPADEKLWEGGEFRFCGSAIRYKKILFISIQARARHLSCVCCLPSLQLMLLTLSAHSTAQHVLVVCPALLSCVTAGVVRPRGLPVSPADGQHHSVLPRGARQIYEVALYLEVDSTAAELKRLRAAGFFAQARPASLPAAQAACPLPDRRVGCLFIASK